MGCQRHVSRVPSAVAAGDGDIGADSSSRRREGGGPMATTTRTEPLVTIRDIRPVDDAGSVHYETTWSAAFLVELVDDQLLKLENNIRPDHNGRMGTKTR